MIRPELHFLQKKKKVVTIFLEIPPRSKYRNNKSTRKLDLRRGLVITYFSCDFQLILCSVIGAR